MANTATKQPGRVKTGMKNVGTKLKDFVKGKAKAVKDGVIDFGAALKEAYRTGYRHGYDTASEVPQRAGAAISAASGYRRGIKDRHKSDKAAAKYTSSRGTRSSASGSRAAQSKKTRK